MKILSSFTRLPGFACLLLTVQMVSAPAAEGRAPEGPAAQGQPPEGPAAQGQPPKARAAEGQAPQGQPPKARAAQGQAPEARAAQGQAPDSLPPQEPPAAAAAMARKLIAARWSVSPDALRLDWGRLKNDAFLEEVDGAELLGAGRDGRWIVSFRRGEDTRSISVRAGIAALRPVARARIPRGQVLSSSDIEYRPVVQWGPLSEEAPAAEAGWIAQRILQPGELLDRPAVRPPRLVETGRPVRLVWEEGALRITIQGKASGSAALGENVYVRTESGQRLVGVVTGPSEVALRNSTSGGMQ